MAAMIDQNVVDRFNALEERLGECHPQARYEAEALAKSIADPQSASADEIWPHAWNKPLFSNTRVATGTDYVSRLAPHMEGAWQHWGKEGDNFRIVKVGNGNRTEAFEASTKQSKEIRSVTGIAMYRLFAIQGAAAALRNRAGQRPAPYADLVNANLSDAVQKVREEMGPGWGHITVLHFLTDLGLACKPDLHLVRAVRNLGMLKDVRDHQVPNLADALTINCRVRSLVEALDGSFSPARLRYVDKTLMDFSRYNLI